MTSRKRSNHRLAIVSRPVLVRSIRHWRLWLNKDYVSCREVPQDGKPDRKVYQITAAGRQQLLNELDNPAPSHKVRSEFLATMAFAHLMTPAQVRNRTRQPH